MNLRNEPINGNLSTIRDVISTENFVIYFEKRLMNGITPTLIQQYQLTGLANGRVRSLIVKGQDEKIRFLRPSI